jgi:dTDP-4-amino-4,6-dideoxygalactose transaminase
MSVPFLDLQAQYYTIQDEIDAAIRSVLESGVFVLGPNVEALQQELAHYCGCGYGVGVASGTDALRLAIDALDIGPGDEVITTPLSFVASANTISRAGARPVFVDVETQTLNLDPVRVERAITERTRAILPVHLYGHPADMDALMELSLHYDLPIIEDSAQAIGASYNGQRVCSFSIVGCLSFFPTKNLGAYGDAGMAVTCDGNLAKQLLVLRQHGGRVRYRHERLGYNSRLDELQAAVLRVKLRHLEAWIEARRRVASYYNDRLAGLPIETPYEAPQARHVYGQYTIQTPRRDDLQMFLREHDIDTRIYYPLPLHLQEMYEHLELGEGAFPEAERAAREVLSLPIYPELTAERLEEVVSAIHHFFESSTPSLQPWRSPELARGTLTRE